jgi:hypothetical protein
MKRDVYFGYDEVRPPKKSTDRVTTILIAGIGVGVIVGMILLALGM